MNVGIDKISFYIPKPYLYLSDLANRYQVDPNKYSIGLRIKKMALAPYNQDVVTLAANAANAILTEDDKENIAMVIFATESTFDYSKSLAIYLSDLLSLAKTTDVIEVKQACFGLTQGLNLAYQYLNNNENINKYKKVLVVSGDIARYKPGTPGEPTGGAGGVAILVSRNPRLLIYNNDKVFKYLNEYDFYKPIEEKYPVVDGHFANELYESMFNEVISNYKTKFNANYQSIKAVSFHVPYAKLPYKIVSKHFNNAITTLFDKSLVYNENVGNIYNGSLYLNLISLLDLKELKQGDTVGLYSYGSGATAQFCSYKVAGDYEKHLLTNTHDDLFSGRVKVNLLEYDLIIKNKSTTNFNDGPFSLEKIDEKYRRYYKDKDAN